MFFKPTPIPEDTDQISWLQEQIALMRVWLREKQNDPKASPDEVTCLATHLGWLEESLENATS